MKGLFAGAEVFSVKGFERPIAKALRGLAEKRFSERLWDKDPGLWKDDERAKGIIRNSLGWLRSPLSMQDNVASIKAFADEARASGFKTSLLLGMGGSSLAPIVLGDAFGERKGYPGLVVADTTDPDTIRQIASGLDLRKTLFIVSSKSGSTIEPMSLFSFFYQRLYGKKGIEAGKNFIAITDPGTSLESLAREKGFRKVFLNQPDIGGRFSALSYFGLVPAALSGIDIGRLLFNSWRFLVMAHPAVPLRCNPSAVLGVALGMLAKAGRDKLTFIMPKRIAGLGLWLEQLIAESTGKDGSGIVPIVGEPLSRPSLYKRDRVFVHIGFGETDKKTTDALKALRDAGHPVIGFHIGDLYELGGEFVRWEAGTAVAGSLLGINPFDQPDVEAAKTLARRLLAERSQEDVLPSSMHGFRDKGIAVYFGEKACRATGAPVGMHCLRDFLRPLKRGDYLAVLAYYNGLDKGIMRAFSGFLKGLRKKTGSAITFGLGPRYLHSTGQLHKGGGANGVYLMFAHRTRHDIEIPGAGFGFSRLELSQAMGDAQALDAKGRRVCIIVSEDGSLDLLKKALKAVDKAI
jgi:glucose-6-phosphate isomerase